MEKLVICGLEIKGPSISQAAKAAASPPAFSLTALFLCILVPGLLFSFFF